MNPLFWFGFPGDPLQKPIIGFAFGNFGKVDFEACFAGLSFHMGPQGFNADQLPDIPYGTRQGGSEVGFIGLSLGC